MKISTAELLKSLINELGETQLSFAKKIGIPQSTLSMSIKRNSDLNSQLIGRIARTYPNVNLDWLLTGEGNILKTDSIHIIPDSDDKDGLIVRIKRLMQYSNLKHIEFASKIDVAPQNLYSMLRGKRPIGEGVLNKILLSFDTINKDWLLFGKGEMIKTFSTIPDPDNKDVFLVSESSSQPYLTTKTGIEYYKFGENKYMMKVPFIPVLAYAKYIDEHRDADTYEGPDYYYFPVNQVYHGVYRAFEIKGDSMDNDTKRSLANGDVVLARELSKEHWKSPLHINDFPNWIIVLNNTILCKQIIKHDINSGEITCHSLNSDPAYADFTINLNEIKELYNIIMVTRSF